MPTADRVFLDTNILAYGELKQSPLFQTTRQRLSDLESAGNELWISRQILREFLSSVSRGVGLVIAPPMSDLIADVRAFSNRYEIAEDGPLVTDRLLQLLDDVSCGGKQVHDANIVATMLESGIKRLLTHNIADFKRFSSYISIEPLVP
jgi:predicted nucleic acid-binding protein